MLEHAVELGRVNLGEDDPEVLAATHQLATVHQQADDPSSARRVLEEAYASGQRRLGDTDPVMLGISFDLGMVAEEMENRHEARRAFSRVAEYGPGVLGADHWAVVRARSYLGESSTVRIQPDAPYPQPVVGQQPITPYQQRTSAAPQPGYRSEQQATAPPSQQPSIAPGYDRATPPNYERAAPTTYGQIAPPSYGQAATPSYGQAGPPLHHPGPQIISAPPITTAVPLNTGAAYNRKAPAVFAAIVAVFGVIIAVVALVVVLANRGDDPDSDVPTLSGPAPSDVRMRDYGSSVQLSWSDPANGRTSFVVTGGHPGEQLSPMGQVGPTTTKFSLQGLNPDLDYCFAVVAVYSTSQFSTSPQTCTSRTRKSAKPSATR